MGRTFLTGDIHGCIINECSKFNSKSFEEGKKLTKKDYVIILGDFGLIWNEKGFSKTEEYWLKWLSNKPWTTLFIDGNHENIPKLYSFPETNKFNNKVGKITESIFHLKRGNIYTINNKTFFVMGGALSVDKENRKEFISWWKEEIPSFKEMKKGLENLEKYNNKIDYILTHTTNRRILEYISKKFNFDIIHSNLQDYLQEIDDKIEYKKWFFAHLHIDYFYNNWECLYNKIIEI